MKDIMKYKKFIWIILFLCLIVISYYTGFEPGKVVYENFLAYFMEMITFIPFLFIIVGLFDVWFPKEKVEKHIGQASGAKGIFVVRTLIPLPPQYGDPPSCVELKTPAIAETSYPAPPSPDHDSKSNEPVVSIRYTLMFL